jgi:hypothetical protein
VHSHALKALGQEFPDLVSARAGAQLHHHLPQDIRLVGAQQLRELGPVDIVVAGWPCQGRSAAGTGQGLNDGRSGLFTDLLRVLHALQNLHKEWRRPLGYLIEHVAAGGDRRPKVQQRFTAVRGLLGPEVVFDAAQVGSRAHPPERLVDQSGERCPPSSCPGPSDSPCWVVCALGVGARTKGQASQINRRCPLSQGGNFRTAAPGAQHVRQLWGVIRVLQRGPRCPCLHPARRTSHI